MNSDLHFFNSSAGESGYKSDSYCRKRCKDKSSSGSISRKRRLRRSGRFFDKPLEEYDQKTIESTEIEERNQSEELISFKNVTTRRGSFSGFKRKYSFDGEINPSLGSYNIEDLDTPFDEIVLKKRKKKRRKTIGGVDFELYTKNDETNTMLVDDYSKPQSLRRSNRIKKINTDFIDNRLSISFDYKLSCTVEENVNSFEPATNNIVEDEMIPVDNKEVKKQSTDKEKNQGDVEMIYLNKIGTHAKSMLETIYETGQKKTMSKRKYKRSINFAEFYNETRRQKRIAKANKITTVIDWERLSYRNYS